jgi:hypothetical protein
MELFYRRKNVRQNQANATTLIPDALMVGSVLPYLHQTELRSLRQVNRKFRQLASHHTLTNRHKISKNLMEFHHIAQSGALQKVFHRQHEEEGDNISQAILAVSGQQDFESQWKKLSQGKSVQEMFHREERNQIGDNIAVSLLCTNKNSLCLKKLEEYTEEKVIENGFHRGAQAYDNIAYALLVSSERKNAKQHFEELMEEKVMQVGFHRNLERDGDNVAMAILSLGQDANKTEKFYSLIQKNTIGREFDRTHEERGDNIAYAIMAVSPLEKIAENFQKIYRQGILDQCLCRIADKEFDNMAYAIAAHTIGEMVEPIEPKVNFHDRVLAFDRYKENMYDNLAFAILTSNISEIPNDALISKRLMGSSDVTETYLKLGANPNVVDENGQTPLHKAAVRKDLIQYQTLVNYGADPFRKNNEGEIPFDHMPRNLVQSILKNRKNRKKTARSSLSHAK